MNFSLVTRLLGLSVLKTTSEGRILLEKRIIRDWIGKNISPPQYYDQNLTDRDESECKVVNEPPCTVRGRRATRYFLLSKKCFVSLVSRDIRTWLVSMTDFDRKIGRYVDSQARYYERGKNNKRERERLSRMLSDIKAEFLE